MIPKIFQVLYDSEGQTLLNNSTTTMSNSIIQSQVKYILSFLKFIIFVVFFFRIKIVIQVKQLNTKVIVLLLLHIVCLHNVKHVIVRVTMYFLHLHVLNVHDVMFVVINNITMIEKNLCYHVEVN
jgi:hypothetical protein